jgi:hypothetical protein
MKIVYLLITFSLFLSQAFCDVTSPLDWVDPVSGTKYDFSSLKKDPKYNKLLTLVIRGKLRMELIMDYSL